MERRKPYPRDMIDQERAFVVRYLTLLSDEAGPRKYTMRELFNGLLHIVNAGC